MGFRAASGQHDFSRGATVDAGPPRKIPAVASNSPQDCGGSAGDGCEVSIILRKTLMALGLLLAVMAPISESTKRGHPMGGADNHRRPSCAAATLGEHRFIDVPVEHVGQRLGIGDGVRDKTSAVGFHLEHLSTGNAGIQVLQGVDRNSSPGRQRGQSERRVLTPVTSSNRTVAMGRPSSAHNLRCQGAVIAPRIKPGRGPALS